MNISTKNFKGCGFPEEYLFWLAICTLILLIISYVYLHIQVVTKHPLRDSFPVPWIILVGKNMPKKDLLLRRIFFILLSLVFFSWGMLKYGFDLGWFSCGSL